MSTSTAWSRPPPPARQGPDAGRHEPRPQHRGAPDAIADRIIHYAEPAGNENVIASADCGFSSRATYRPRSTRRSSGRSSSARRGRPPRHREALVKRRTGAYQPARPSVLLIMSSTSSGTRSGGRWSMPGHEQCTRTRVSGRRPAGSTRRAAGSRRRRPSARREPRSRPAGRTRAGPPARRSPAENDDARAAERSCSAPPGVAAGRRPDPAMTSASRPRPRRSGTLVLGLDPRTSGPTIAASSSRNGNPGMPGQSSTSADTRSGCASTSPSAVAPPWLHPTIAVR